MTTDDWSDENSRKGRLCSIPKAKSKEKLSSFQVLGPKLFNCLPKEIRNVTNCGIEEFKSILDMFLTWVPDEPKAGGLTPGAMTPDAISTNSLAYQIPRAWKDGLMFNWNQMDTLRNTLRVSVDTGDTTAERAPTTMQSVIEPGFPV